MGKEISFFFFVRGIETPPSCARGEKRYLGYVKNGFRFNTKDHEMRKKTQNGGIFLSAFAESYSIRKDKRLISDYVNYYGILTDILELHYPNK